LAAQLRPRRARAAAPDVGAAARAEKIRARVAAPYAISGDTIEISISIGIAIYAVQTEEYADLIRLADREMYRDKASRPVPFNTGDGGSRLGAAAVACASMPG
jgi:GGDEF domain-containing protein